MPKIIEKPISELFAKISKTAEAFNGGPDSMVVAIACAADVSYTRAKEVLLKINGSKPTEEARAREALRQLGFKMIRVQPEVIISRYPAGYQRAKYVTTHHPDRFPEGFVGFPTLLMFTNRRVVCYKNGETHDWSRNRSMRATDIFKVLPAS